MSKFELATGVLVLCLLMGTRADEKLATITSKSGIYTGKTKDQALGTISRYLGVPYAQAPIGWLRFRAPQPVEDSTNRVDSTKLKPSCIQMPHLSDALHPVLRAEDQKLTAMSEDCLFLNIYVPQFRDHADKLPVIVWIAGEGFDYAKANQFDGTDLALASKSIVVTVNYRVSVLGFLSTGDHHVPGNMGMLDQQMALKWIKHNIEAFGGDSDRVTLAGRFTGSMAITAHLVSPMNLNQGYFQRVILQSGIATGPYVFSNNPKNGTRRLAKSVGCNKSETGKIMNCLRNVDPKLLIKRAMELNQLWTPVIDGSFLLEDPIKAVENGRYDSKVNVILGMNSDEGSMCLLTHQFLKTPSYSKILADSVSSEDLADLMKTNIEDFYKESVKGLDHLSLFQYSNRCSRSHRISNRLKYVDFCGDMYFKSSIIRMADALYQRGTKVWAYKFHHRPSSSIYPSFITAAHGDDVLFSLGLINKDNQVTFKEENLSFLMMKAWGNFARSGSPQDVSGTPWPNYDSKKQSFFRWTIKSPEQSVRRNLRSTEVRFWNSVVPKLI